MNPLTSLGGRDRRALVAAGLVIPALLALGRGVPALRAWERERVASSVELAGELASAQASLAQTRVLGDSLRVRRQRFLNLAASIVSGEAPAAASATLAALLNGSAVGAGLRLESVQIAGDSLAGRVFTRVSARGEATGDSRALTQFLLALERGPMLLAVRELTVTQPEPAGASTQPEALRIEFTVSGLSLNPRARRAK